jgi:hypothetical protein
MIHKSKDGPTRVDAYGEHNKGRFTADIRRIYSVDQKTVEAD